MIETGTFLIADISGYTEYLARADLEHGPVIATDLLTRLMEVMRPTFEINKLEGDAIFSYSGDATLSGADLIDVIDGAYAAFRRRLVSVGQATSCACAACSLVPGLDLKLIAHSGRFSRQEIAGRTELVGSDVIVVHRLLKNTLGFAGPASGYMLVTEASVQRLGIDPNAQALTAHLESYPHLGEVEAWVGNLRDRFDRQPTWQPPTAPIYVASRLLSGVPGEVWNLLAPGRADSCVTDRLSSIHEVVEWRPFERMVVEVEAPEATVLYEVDLNLVDEETLATIRWYRGRRRRHAPGWKDIRSRLATITSEILEQAQDRFGQSG